MRSILAVGFVLALVGSTALAQDQEKPRRGGGGFGGRGGPGMGTQESLGILSMPEVQKELGLDDAKKKEVGEVVEKTQQELMASRSTSANFRDLSKEDQQKKMEEFRVKGEELNKKAVEQLGKILDAKQLERYQQLRLQREGVAALGRPEVAQKLELSQEQKDKVKKIQDDARRDSGFGGGGTGGRLSDEERREFLAKREERVKKVNTDLLAVLTSAQKESWDKMLGTKFEFPQRQFGGPGGGFGGGRRGAQGAGGGEGGGEKKRPEAKKDA